MTTGGAARQHDGPAGATGRLRARTRRVDGDVDLLERCGGTGLLFERAGTGLAGRGVARRVRLEEAATLLATAEVDDEVGRPGCGPVAFGALPFVADPGAELVVPRVVWGRSEDGTRWVTEIEVDGPPAGPGPDAVTGDRDGEGRAATVADAATGDGQPAALAPAADRAGPDLSAPVGRVTIAPTVPAAEWCALVERATKAIAAAGPGGLAKVVLARELVLEADRPFPVASVLAHLRRGYPGCFLFHVDGFLGASPELLVARHDDVVRAQPMAGTAARGGDPITDARLGAALLASPTYRHEHQVTIDMVYDTLLPWCSYLDYEAEPSVVAVANVQHLATLVEGRLSRPAPSVLELVGALHPTPAVAGWPRDLATDWILANEGIDRGPYAGAVGWVDGQGNGSWAVSIRCARVEGSVAHVHAGNGIVADSDPATELAETQAKFQAVLGALTRL